MRKLKPLYGMLSSFLIAMLMVVWIISSNTPASATPTCSEPPAGSVVQNPPEINNFTRNRPVKLTTIGEPKKGADAVNAKTCYNSDAGLAPTIRINPGDIGRILPLQLTNGFPAHPSSQKQLQPSESIDPQQDSKQGNSQRCGGNMLIPYATSLHFHGFNVSPRCGQDEVVKTVIAPGQTFNYQLQVPGKEPPGLYWYHPHIHMQSEDQVVSGSTGALILNGIGKFNPKAAKLPERVFVLRDRRKRDPSDAQEPVKDISINSVPIRYQGNGKYDPPAVIEMPPEQEQFWRVANTAADSYFNLQLVYDRSPQPLELVSLDGVPINSDPDLPKTLAQVDRILLPPAARAEFIVKAPAANVKAAKLMALQVDTPDTTPDRVLATIQTTQSRIDNNPTSVESRTALAPVSGDRFFGLGNANPVQQRQFTFSKNEQKGEFYITEAGKPRQVYDMNAKEPNVSVQEGTTEDWTIQNQDNEIHAFHIHQIHFLVLDSPDANEKNTLRDTINVPVKQSVKLRMDFRGIGSSIAGTFVYHCHILEHEDGGMMGSIQVVPKAG